MRPVAGFKEGQMSGSALDKNGKVPRADRKTKVVHARFSAIEMEQIEDAARGCGADSLRLYAVSHP